MTYSLLIAAVLVAADEPKSPADLRAETLRLLEAGKGRDALAMAERFVAAAPDSHFAFDLRGRAYAGLGQPEKAIADFSKAVELEPKFAAALDRRGGEYFKLGKIKECLEDFDTVVKEVPSSFPSHWRRGIALYYAGRYKDGAEQFDAGQKDFPNDVENVFWHWLCNVKELGREKADAQLLKIGRDGRSPMMEVLGLIQGKLKAEDVLKAAADAPEKERAEAEFYAHLYLGLYYEVTGDEAKSREQIALAAKKRISHYMGDVAVVHQLLRAKK